MGIDIGVLFEGVDLVVDAASHAIYQGDQIQGMRGWWAEADGDEIDLETINKLRLAVEQVAMDIYVKYKSFDLEKKKEFYCRQKAWGYKKLFDSLRLGWEPRTEILDAAKNKPLFDQWAFSADRSETIRLLRKIFDPRQEIPTEAYRK